MYSFLLLILLISGCTSPVLKKQILAPTAHSTIQSFIDAGYISQRSAQRFQSENNNKYVTKSPGITFYQKIIGQTLASECDWYPNDSLSAQNIYKICGGFKTAPLAFARFIDEPNAATSGYPIIVTFRKVYFYDFKNDCYLF